MLSVGQMPALRKADWITKSHSPRHDSYFTEMIDLDTPFHRRVKKLKAPTSAQFDAAAWKSLPEGDTARSDLELLAGAMLIAAEMQAFRARPADFERDALDAATAPDVDGPSTTRTLLSATYF